MIYSHQWFQDISFRFSNRTKALLNNRLSHCRQIHNYYNINEKSNIGGTIEDYIEYEMSVNGTWGSTFEMICVSIIYRVHIISIADISGRCMVYDTLSLLNAYQIANDNSVISDRYDYLYYHVYKAPITSCVQDIIFNHFGRP